MIKTSCEKCIFATFENGIQNGCTLGKISKYIDRNLANLDGNHYVINKFCNTCRSSDQFKLTEEQVKEQVKIKFAVIINGLNGDYWRTTKSLLDQTIIPKKVFVIVDKFNEADKYMEFIKWFSDTGSQLTIKKYFNIENVNKCIDDVVKKLNKSYYYTVINNDSQLDNNYFEKINYEINENLYPLTCLFRDNYGSYYNTYSVQLHNMLNGNVEESLKSKVLKRYEEEKDKKTIWLESQLS